MWCLPDIQEAGKQRFPRARELISGRAPLVSMRHGCLSVASAGCRSRVSWVGRGCPPKGFPGLPRVSLEAVMEMGWGGFDGKEPCCWRGAPRCSCAEGGMDGDAGETG